MNEWGVKKIVQSASIKLPTVFCVLFELQPVDSTECTITEDTS
jgi:hypothetical protein